MMSDKMNQFLPRIQGFRSIDVLLSSTSTLIVVNNCQYFFCIPTSTSSVRRFSEMGSIISKLRAKLHSEIAGS
jgi:hypothetical protein